MCCHFNGLFNLSKYSLNFMIKLISLFSLFSGKVQRVER